MQGTSGKGKRGGVLYGRDKERLDKEGNVREEVLERMLAKEGM